MMKGNGCARIRLSQVFFLPPKSGKSNRARAAMQRHQLEHIIRAAAGITGADRFVIIGSQAILGQYPNAPHQTFGYYAHGVGAETAILPAGWRERLVPVQNANTGGGSGLCLE